MRGLPVIKRGMAKLALTVFAALAFCATGCTRYTNPATGKQHSLWFMNPEKEKTIGKQVYVELGKKPGFSRDAAARARVERVGRRVVAVCDDRSWKYRFEVLNTRVPNAFAAPGGYIFVTNGLLAMMGDNDDELAAVLGHEAGHIAAKHTAARMDRAMKIQGVVAILAAGSGEDNAKAVAELGMVVGSFLLLSHSRKQEYEADKLGVRYSHEAGYNPEGMVTFFQKLSKLEAKAGGGGKLPNFMSTHPSTPDRIDKVKRMIRDVRRKSKRKRKKRRKR